MQSTQTARVITVDALETDPYPIYTALREHAPVAWVPCVNLWFVTRWGDVWNVVNDTTHFTSAQPHSAMTRTIGKNMLHADGMDHRRMRDALEPPLRPVAVRRYAEEEIPALAGALLDSFVAQGAGDLMALFAEPFAVRMLQHILALDAVPEAQFRGWYTDLGGGIANFEGDPSKQAAADRASREIDAAIETVLCRLEGSPNDSILSAMLHTEIGGYRLTREEIFSSVKLMIIGGVQEARDIVGFTTWALLAHPEQAAAALTDAALLRKAIEETLRWHSPVGTLTRTVTQPVTVAGVALERGAMVAAVIASANRDERHWSAPERFDIHRAEGKHLAFGLGPHHCIGALLSRYEAAVTVRLIFERLVNLRLDPAHPAALHGWEFHCCISICVGMPTAFCRNIDSPCRGHPLWVPSLGLWDTQPRRAPTRDAPTGVAVRVSEPHWAEACPRYREGRLLPATTGFSLSPAQSVR